MRKAEVYLYGIKVGILTENEQGYSFQYDTEYANNPQSIPVSMLLPLRQEPYWDRMLFPFFDGLIPEGWLLAIVQETWKLHPRDRMGLLLTCCHDCIGAASIRAIES